VLRPVLAVHPYSDCFTEKEGKRPHQYTNVVQPLAKV
jgi:hypothetical protein